MTTDNNEVPELLDPFGGPQDGFDPEFLFSYTGWEGVTSGYDPWRDEGPPPGNWEKPDDWPDDWRDHLAEWRAEGIEAGTWEWN